MKKSHTLIAIAFLHFSMQAQIINIPDANFKAKLLEAGPDNNIAIGVSGFATAVDTNGNGEIEVSEAAAISNLNLGNSAIASLEGLQSFSEISNVRCENNNLTSLTLDGLQSLSFLDCSHNQIADLHLTNMPVLGNIYCTHNQLHAIDLVNLSQTYTIDCSYNQISTIDFSGVGALKTLNCSHNQLTGLSSNMFPVTINELDCSYNSLGAADLNSLLSMQTLTCSHNQLSELNINQINNSISFLDCSYNNLTGLVLPNFFEFQDMNFNPRALICNHNQLSSITFNLNDGHEDFGPLDLSYNSFADLDLSHLRVYGSANISNNPLTNVTFSDFYITDPEAMRCMCRS